MNHKTSQEFTIISALVSELLLTQNIKDTILTFIVNNKLLLKELQLHTLNLLREKYLTSLESILLLISLAEISKVIKNKNIRVFILYLSQNNKNISIEKFIKDEIPFFYDDNFLNKSFHKSLPLFYQYIQKTTNIVFETRYKLAKFSEKIGIADISSNNFRTDLSTAQKQELKSSMFDMTKDFYISIYPIYDYLVKTQINITDALNYQTIEDNQRLIDGIKFYIRYDHKKAFSYLEKLKSKIFMENLSLRNQNEFKELNTLKEKVFHLQSQAYKQEDIFEYIEKLYKAKFDLHAIQIKYKTHNKNSLEFHKLKGLL